ncbi:MAG: 23S rRNA (pseudouridine(1915)-N(3))-methyltransferase RlmH [Alphaproteobacteria bacterium]|nr:23S rRNA (pseudouridine(1915)-N(3))-methyltransferase RlmH [Alphaproteobacteria bacterium]
MRITIAAIGKLKPGPHRDLAAHYAGRLRTPLAIREVEERRKLSPAELKAREAALLLDAIPKGATIVALDERGTALSSVDFAKRIARWRDSGVADLAFAIGGADGLAETVRRQAAFVLSLGPATWPHFLVRGMLLEQLYRAETLLAGHPYHRE